MKLKLEMYGVEPFKKALKVWDKTVEKDLKALCKKICDTAIEYIKSHAPYDTDHDKHKNKQGIPHYRDTLTSEVARGVARWVESVYPGATGQSRKGGNVAYVANWLEYGFTHVRSGRKIEGRGYIQKGIQYALDLHENEIKTLMAASWRRVLREFIING